MVAPCGRHWLIGQFGIPVGRFFFPMLEKLTTGNYGVLPPERENPAKLGEPKTLPKAIQIITNKMRK